MGFAISWLAVKGKSPGAITQKLGLTPTGEITDYGESLFTGRTLSSGWFLLVINQCEHDFVKPESLASLSSKCEVIACSIEEHVMFCSSELWRNGAQIWCIEHDAQKSIEHISNAGSLPDGYSAIEKEFSDEQKKAGGKKADTDYFFEIPLQVAKTFVGFKHDESSSDDDGFEVFKGPSRSSSPVNRISVPGQKPWWKLW
jgi:hypothetical protein